MDHDHPSAAAPDSPLSPKVDLPPTPTPTTTTTTAPNSTATAKISKEDRQTKGRNRHAPFQTEALNQVFARTDHPTLQERTDLAKRLSMEIKVVNSWFQNKRATLKKRAMREAAQSNGVGHIEDSPPPPSSQHEQQQLLSSTAPIIIIPPSAQAAAHMHPSNSSRSLIDYHHQHASLPPTGGRTSLPPISSLLHPPSRSQQQQQQQQQQRQTSPSTDQSDAEDDARSVQLAPIYDRTASPVDTAAYRAHVLPPQPYDHHRRLPSAQYDYEYDYDPRSRRTDRRVVSAYAPYPPPHPADLAHHAAIPRRMRSLSPSAYDDGAARWYAHTTAGDRAHASRASFDASSQASSRSRSPAPAVARYAAATTAAPAWAHHPAAQAHCEDMRSVGGWSEPEYEPASDPESDSPWTHSHSHAAAAAAAAAAAGKRKRGAGADPHASAAPVSAAGAGGAKTRQRLNARQVKELREFYAHTTHPTRNEQEQLAEEIGLRVHSVTIWFQNQRSMDKRRRLGAATNGTASSVSPGGESVIPGPPSRVSSVSDRPSPPSAAAASTHRRANGATVAPSRPRRSRPEPAQLEALKRLYAQTTTPSIEQRSRLAVEIGMETAKVTNWFRNLRQTAKKKAPSRSDESSGSARDAPPSLQGEEDDGASDMDAEDEGMSDSDSREASLEPPSRAHSPLPPRELSSAEEDGDEDGQYPPKRRRLSAEDTRMEVDPAAHDTGSDEEEAVTPPPSALGRHQAAHHNRHHEHYHVHQHHAAAHTLSAFAQRGIAKLDEPVHSGVAVEDAVLLLSLRGQA